MGSGSDSRYGDGLAVCERLRQQGSPHVGEATVFVSWFLATTIETLLDALANFLEEKGLREEDTFFWVCDYVIRQTNVDPDLALLGECVSAFGHTVLLMELVRFAPIETLGARRASRSCRGRGWGGGSQTSPCTSVRGNACVLPQQPCAVRVGAARLCNRSALPPGQADPPHFERARAAARRWRGAS